MFILTILAKKVKSHSDKTIIDIPTTTNTAEIIHVYPCMRMYVNYCSTIGHAKQLNCTVHF